jgi:hypothetical protein
MNGRVWTAQNPLDGHRDAPSASRRHGRTDACRPLLLISIALCVIAAGGCSTQRRRSPTNESTHSESQGVQAPRAAGGVTRPQGPAVRVVRGPWEPREGEMRRITRFLWDMLDTSTDAGNDATDLNMPGFTTVMENMPCSGTDFGVNGSCNEFDRSTPSACSPATEGATSPTGTGTRDSYNAWDLAAAIQGDQSSERTLNCVQGATD